jgi:hypothetical protein
MKIALIIDIDKIANKVEKSATKEYAEHFKSVMKSYSEEKITLKDIRVELESFGSSWLIEFIFNSIFDNSEGYISR